MSLYSLGPMDHQALHCFQYFMENYRPCLFYRIARERDSNANEQIKPTPDCFFPVRNIVFPARFARYVHHGKRWIRSHAAASAFRSALLEGADLHGCFSAFSFFIYYRGGRESNIEANVVGCRADLRPWNLREFRFCCGLPNTEGMPNS